MALRKNAKVDLIRRAPLFSRCSRKELEQIAAVADELDVPAGKELIREGDRGREFFVIVEGEVDVRKGRRQLKTLKDGDFFGEIALVSDIPRIATVTANTATRVLVISDRSLRSLLERSPQMHLKILDALGRRVIETTGLATL